MGLLLPPFRELPEGAQGPGPSPLPPLLVRLLHSQGSEGGGQEQRLEPHCIRTLCPSHYINLGKGVTLGEWGLDPRSVVTGGLKEQTLSVLLRSPEIVGMGEEGFRGRYGLCPPGVLFAKGREQSLRNPLLGASSM